MGLIHNINRNEYQLAREFELGRMRIAASADLLTAENGRKRLRDDLFVEMCIRDRYYGCRNHNTSRFLF